MKARKVKGLDPAGRLDANAGRIITVRLAELRDLAPAALEPGNSDEQHDMRIAAKRLRYVLEVTGFCVGDAGQDARREARRLQEVLGEMRDCDEMLPRVQARRPGDHGLGVLEVYLSARRRHLFEQFRELWAEQERGRVWSRLDDAAGELSLA